MKNLLLLILAVSISLIPSIPIYSWGQSDENEVLEETTAEETVPPPLEKGGGLEEINTGSEEVFEALNILEQKLSYTNPEIRIMDVIQAFHQVAAGYNTILICTYEDTVQSATLKLFARVYTNLKNEKNIIQLELDYSEQ